MIYRFLSYLKPYWGRELLVLLLLLIANAGALASPYALKSIIDNVFPSKNYEMLIFILSVLTSIYIVRLLSAFASDYLYAWISDHIVYNIRADLFKHLMALPLNFYNENKVGEIVHRINNEVERIQSILTGSVIRLLNNLFTIVGIVIMLCYLNYQLFLVSIILFPVALLNTRYFHSKIHNIIQSVREQDSAILNFFSERFNNIKLIKALNSYHFESKYLNTLLKEYIRLDIRYTLVSSFSRSLTTACVILSPVIVLAWGGKQVISGQMTLGALVAYMQYLNRLYPPSRDLLSLYTDLLKGLVSMRRIFEFMKEPQENLRQDSLVKVNGANNLIVFSDIYFAYKNQNVLAGLNLKLTNCTRYAIVGKSGCGKSTLMQLLFGLQLANRGEIKINETHFDLLNLYDWREKVALISQDMMFYNATIKENISYGSPGCSEIDIDRVCKIVGLDKHIASLDERYDTIIGDKGKKLSGGQQQRLTIARAILKDFEILILDEATSALDSESECEIIQNLINEYKDKIIIIISHRLSTIKYADEIIVLENGCVVENGSLASLMKSKSYFFDLFRNQILKDEDHPAVH